MQPEIIPIPAFTDNYIWLIREADSNRVRVVDPGDAAPVLQYLQQHDLQLAAILLTHHHPDHTGGVDDLLHHNPVPVYGPRSSRIPRVSHPLEHGDSIPVGGFRYEVLEVPGHTLDHIAFHAPMSESPDAAPLLFCGDTLFAGGCGRLFEGTPAMMLQSLERLKALPDNTLVYCAHEYTRANLTFALAAEPDNRDLQERFSVVRQLRDEGRITLPSSIDLEKRTNPFLRCQKAGVVQQITARLGHPPADETETFAALRQWKDVF